MPSTVAEWLDPRTLIALGGLIIGIAGFLFGLLSHRWTRRESVREALSDNLLPLVRCAQALTDANQAREKCEQLKRSYPVLREGDEASFRINELIDTFGEKIKSAKTEQQ